MNIGGRINLEKKKKNPDISPISAGIFWNVLDWISVAGPKLLTAWRGPAWFGNLPSNSSHIETTLCSFIELENTKAQNVKTSVMYMNIYLRDCLILIRAMGSGD